MIGYLVIQTGCEGIEEICGLFERDAAIAKIKELREKDMEISDFYCVQRVDENGAECVCSELGVKPSKPMFR